MKGPAVDRPASGREARSRDAVGALIREALTVAATAPGAAPECERLRDLAGRLDEGRFRLAVIGQFKRGKSTLLNALIGTPLLPTAVLPATAVATFVAGGSAPGLTLVRRDGSVEHPTVPNVEAVATRLGAAVTEAGNPGNVLALDRVEVTLPSALLGDDIVLVDTPGIGSTHRHNTDAGRAALSRCDAALIVFSADLPVTELEVAYLAETRALVPTVLVAMTKADLASDHDREALLGFLHARLDEGSPSGTGPTVWVVSARDALAAKMRGDREALGRSGLPALEDHLRRVLARAKEDLLAAAIAGQAARCVAALRSTLTLRHAALDLPLDDLDRRIARFDTAMDTLREQRRTARDLLEGDRRRARSAFETDCDALYDEAVSSLRPELARAIVAAPTADAAGLALAAAVACFFDAARDRLAARVEADAAAAIRAQRMRLDAVRAGVADATTEIMAVARQPREATGADPPMREPYWVASGSVDTLGSLTADGLLHLLPRPAREARARRRLRAGLDAAIVRNVSSLQWALGQWLDDVVRRCGPRLDAEIEAESAAVRKVLTLSRESRSRTLGTNQEERDALSVEIKALQRIERGLTARGAVPAAVSRPTRSRGEPEERP